MGHGLRRGVTPRTGVVGPASRVETVQVGQDPRGAGHEAEQEPLLAVGEGAQPREPLRDGLGV